MMLSKRLLKFIDMYNINSVEELLEQYINSNQDSDLGDDIFVAVFEENVLSKFFAAKKENKVNTRKINDMFLDEILAQTEKEKWNTDSTRHKSRNGESHTEVPKFEAQGAWNYLPDMLGIINPSKFVNTDLTQKGNVITSLNKETAQKVRANFKGSNCTATTTFDSLELAEKFFETSTYVKAWYYTFGDEVFIKEDSKKIPQKDDVITSSSRGERETLQGIKETEGKLNYELDWEFIEQMAQRMNQNKGKYPPYNWTKDMDVEKLKQSLFRHVIQVMQGNYSDDGRPFGHWESIALNAMMINYQLKLQNQK